MMKSGKNNKRLIPATKTGTRLICITIPVLSIVAAIAATLGIILWTGDMRSDTLSLYSQFQKYEAAELITDANGDIGALLSSITSKTSSATFWSLYRGEEVLFERNTATTESLNGYSLSNIRTSYLRAGGEGIEEFFSALGAGEDFNTIITRDKTLGAEISTTVFADINGEKYALCRSALVSFVLASSGINGPATAVTILTGILSAIGIILAFGGAYMIIRREKLIIEQNGEIVRKNLTISELQEAGEGSCDSSERDAETALYGRTFLMELLKNLDESEEVDAGIILVKIERLDELTFLGEIKPKKLVRSLAEILLKESGRNDVCARISHDTFAVITSSAECTALAERISAEAETLRTSVTVTFTANEGRASETIARLLSGLEGSENAE